jgi:hypothetical protein
MNMDDALESLGYLIKSEDKVEKLSFRYRLGEKTGSVEPLGFGVHSASNALTALVAASNIVKVTEVFFRRFDG